MRSFVRAGAGLIVLALLVSTAETASAETPGTSTPPPDHVATGGRTEATTPPVRRVLEIALPAVSWADVTAPHLPNLQRLFAASAIADLATRSVRQRTSPADGYAALGAGARAVGSATAGQNLEPHERFGNSSAADVFQRRTGVPLREDIGVLSIPSINDANDGLPYDAVAGTLGKTLTESGVGRGVVANADEDELEPAADAFHREAALAMMDPTGRVPAGRVDDGLLMRDPAAPFGLRLDRNAVMRSFTQAWDSRARSVVLVEASDLARANAYRPLASAHQRAAMRRAALRSTDRLVGRLLRHVDPAHDAVLVVGPYHSSLRREVTVAALRGPGVAPGFLETGTTRRQGFVQIVDIAPTVLKLLGINRPEEMEGRPFDVDASSTPYPARVKTLIRANRAAVFRDTMIGKATAALVILTLLLAAAALIVFRRRLVGVTEVLELAALAVLGFLVGTFVAGLLPFYKWSKGSYWLFLLLFALVYGLVCRTFGRRHPADALLLGLGGMALLHLLDALTGTRLEFNTVFGYTPTIGIRLAGLGNPGSAQLCASALLFAALLAWRVAPPGGRRAAVAFLTLTVVVVGAPFFGQDFGGAISAAPAYLLLGLLLYGRRITVKAVALLAAVLVGAGLIVGLIDLTRPSDKQTHVGRFFQKVGDEGVSGFTTVVGRKLSLMLQTFHNTGWVLLVLGIVGSLAYVAWRTDRLRVLAVAVPVLKPMLVAFAVLAVLGTVLNDSGVQVMGMMLAVLVPTLVVLACRELVPPETEPEPVTAEPAPEVSAGGVGTAPARSPA
ncbi:MAG TPA: hypothetical protein VGN59_15105 [Acidimicrobiia bacterium]